MGVRVSPATAQAVINRDRGRCIWCGATDALDLAHISSRGARPDLVDDPQNICQLCCDCHRVLQHQQGSLTTPLLQERLTMLYGIVYPLPPRGKTPLPARRA